MSKRTVFQELSRFMPDQEREELLKKIKKSLYVPEEVEDRKYHREIDNNIREEALKRDIDALSWFSRLIMWVLSKIRGKKIREIFIASQIKRLKKSINAQYPGLTGFESRDLHPQLATEIFGIYTLVANLRSIFRLIWTQSDDFERMFMSLLDERIPHSINELFDFISLENMQTIYIETKSIEKIKDEVNQKFDKYIKSIPIGIFQKLENDMRPITYLKDLVLFHFMAFFELFNFTPEEKNRNQEISFKAASAMLSLDYLERLHYALYQVAALENRTQMPKDILLYLTKVQLGIEEEERKEFEDQFSEDDSNGEQAELQETQSVIEPTGAIAATIQRLIVKAQAVFQTVPLENLVRYFQKDPYYELVRSVPELRLKELYVTILRLKLVAQVEKLHPEIRRRMIDSEIALMFEGKKITKFQNYQEFTSADNQDLDLPTFRYAKTVTLLNNYVRIFYKDYLDELVQILNRGVLSQNLITRDRLLQHSTVAEDMELRLAAFDYSLAPESKDGKLFQRLRFTLGQEPNHQKMYRTLILQKDRELESLIDRAAEALTGLKNVFEEIGSSTSDTIKSQLGDSYFIKGKPLTLSQILKERIAHLQRFNNVLDQVYKLDKG